MAGAHSTRQGSSTSARATEAGACGSRYARRERGKWEVGRGRHETRTPDSTKAAPVPVIIAWGRATSVRPLPPRTLLLSLSCISASVHPRSASTQRNVPWTHHPNQTATGTVVHRNNQPPASASLSR